MTNEFQYVEVTNSESLNILKERAASFEDLKFTFSEAYLDSLKSQLSEPNALQIIVKEHDDFCGYVASSEQLFPGYLYISELFVEPSMSGKGIGTELIKQVVKRAKEAGLSGVMTQTEKENVPAQRLYEKCGFSKVDNPNWREGITYKLTI